MKFESYAANAIFNAFGQNRPNTLTNYLTVKLSQAQDSGPVSICY